MCIPPRFTTLAHTCPHTSFPSPGYASPLSLVACAGNSYSFFNTQLLCHHSRKSAQAHTGACEQHRLSTAPSELLPGLELPTSTPSVGLIALKSQELSMLLNKESDRL